MILQGFLVIFSVFHQVGGYSTGAPYSTCFTLYPKHSGTPTLISECPFKFTFSPDPFQPGDTVTVNIGDPAGGLFKGIELGAHRADDNKQAFLGQYVDFPEDKLKTFNCFSGYKNMITHKNNMSISSLSLKWKAPNEYVGDIIFRGTLVADYGTFWVDVENVLKAAPSTSSPAPSLYPVIQTRQLVNDIDFGACGNTKGCFLYPRFCGGDDCVAAATYEYRSATDDFLVELFTKEGPNYISLGLSYDRIMGNDATFTCTSNMGLMSVQPGWNPSYYNERQLTRNMTDLEVREKDGNILCRFVMPAEVEVYHMIQDSLTFDYTTQQYDAKEKWYLMLAWGKTMPESNVLSHHVEMPTTTYSKVDMRSASISYGSAFHVMVQVHASMMVIGWVLFTGIVTIVSRHYKNWLPQKTLLGTKVWFQIHRELAILVTVFTAIGLIVIFYHYGKEITELSKPHSTFGLVLTGCVGMQIIAGFLRPGGDHKLRPLFNWGHFFLGQGSHILAAITMYYAFDIVYITPTMRQFGFITLSVWVGGQVLWHIIFDFVRNRNTMSAKTDSFNMDTGKTEVENDKSSKMETFLFGIYILSLIIICVAVLCSILLY